MSASVLYIIIVSIITYENINRHGQSYMCLTHCPIDMQIFLIENPSMSCRLRQDFSVDECEHI